MSYIPTPEQAEELPSDAYNETGRHARDNAGLCRFLPEQRRERGDTGGRRVKAPCEHEYLIGVLYIQRYHQRAQRQDHGKDTREQYFFLFGHIRIKGLAYVMHAGLHGNKQITVRRGHDDGQNAGQC